jgi:GNAT superfamily N-acetyltransferase
VPTTHDSIKLRPSTPEDDPFLLEVYSSTRDTELEGIGWDDNQKRAFLQMQYAAQVRCYPEADNRIILSNDCPIGRMLIRSTEEAVLLMDIALLTQYRNAGIGTALLKDLLRQAAAAGKVVRLHVLFSNPAIRLYERLGFKVSDNSSATHLEMTWKPA